MNYRWFGVVGVMSILGQQMSANASPPLPQFPEAIDTAQINAQIMTDAAKQLSTLTFENVPAADIEFIKRELRKLGLEKFPEVSFKDGSYYYQNEAGQAVLLVRVVDPLSGTAERNGKRFKLNPNKPLSEQLKAARALLATASGGKSASLYHLIVPRAEAVLLVDDAVALLLVAAVVANYYIAKAVYNLASNALMGRLKELNTSCQGLLERAARDSRMMASGAAQDGQVMTDNDIGAIFTQLREHKAASDKSLEACRKSSVDVLGAHGPETLVNLCKSVDVYSRCAGKLGELLSSNRRALKGQTVSGRRLRKEAGEAAGHVDAEAPVHERAPAEGGESAPRADK